MIYKRIGVHKNNFGNYHSRMKCNRKILLFIFVILFVACGSGKTKNDGNPGLVNYNIALPDLVDSLHITKSDARILVSKADYTLAIVVGDKVVKSYPIVLGNNPVDDKLREGDRCTPEGVFKIRDKYPHQSWTKFIWVDYPNEESEKKHQQAKEQGTIPKDAGIGGEVGIHGVPNGADYLIDDGQNWTWGCISLKNADVNEIYDFVYIGMTVEIKN